MCYTELFIDYSKEEIYAVHIQYKCYLQLNLSDSWQNPFYLMQGFWTGNTGSQL